jgi:hypothetical protein
MGISRITHLFDLKEFRKEFEPLIGQLNEGYLSGLKSEAQELVRNEQVDLLPFPLVRPHFQS